MFFFFFLVREAVRGGVSFDLSCATWGVAVWSGPLGEATSYLSIDSSRSSDGRKAREVRDAVWGARSGASRNLRCDVRASDRVLGSLLQDARGHRFQMGALSIALEGASARERAFTWLAPLDVVARDVRLGVRSRR